MEKAECSIPSHKIREFSITGELPYWARATELVSPSSSDSCYSEYYAGLTALICGMACLLLGIKEIIQLNMAVLINNTEMRHTFLNLHVQDT